MTTCINCTHAVAWVETADRAVIGNLVCSNEFVNAFHVDPTDTCKLFSPQPEEADDEEPFPPEISVAIQSKEDPKADWIRLAQPNFD